MLFFPKLCFSQFGKNKKNLANTEINQNETSAATPGQSKAITFKKLGHVRSYSASLPAHNMLFPDDNFQKTNENEKHQIDIEKTKKNGHSSQETTPHKEIQEDLNHNETESQNQTSRTPAEYERTCPSFLNVIALD